MLEKITVDIPAFNEKRDVTIYLPSSYTKETTKRYEVLYFQDGQNVFHDHEAFQGVSLDLKSYLDKNEFELIVVAIDVNSDERLHHYCPWENGEWSREVFGLTETTGGKGHSYVEFLVNSLKPLIDNKYRTIKTKSSIAGISLGGAISVYAAGLYPHIFPKVAGISTAFYRNQEKFEEFLKGTDLSGIEKLYLDCGTKEAKDNEGINAAFLESNQRMFSILKEKLVDYQFPIIDEGIHQYADFKKRIPAIFNYLYSS
ncbi:alpha/beta hydrolase [Bacillus weihaiensis]|uniref:Esterase n=1 Tax=Bacillus weihaiensis TaxID=1547283 RepID=A0A1L3MX29_9BACI|nr:alpha/beta hydrolase-fold protein [Bacillus weihaiensis]APH06894.1 esterase [Bacillus weihaiensis]